MQRLALAAVLLAACKIEFNPEFIDTSTESDGTSGTTTTGPTTTGPTTTGPTTTGPTTSTSTLTDGTGACTGGDMLWWNRAWSFRRTITFDNSAQTETLDGFPVLVTFSSSELPLAQTKSDGTDVRFIDPDGSELPYHIETWNDDGVSALWVQAAAIDGGSSDDFIWMYYGNTEAADVTDPQGTYDMAYAGVWHLAEAAGSHLNAASGLECTWLGGGSGTQDATGLVGGANRFDGNDDAVNCGVDQVGDISESTISAWVRLPLTGDADQEVVSSESLTNPFPGVGLYVRRNDGAIGKWLGGGYTYASAPANRVPADEWTFIAIRAFKDQNAGLIEVSKNGGTWEPIITGDTRNLAVPPDTPLVLGKWSGSGPSASTQGRIDEVRLSRVARSDDWVRAEFLSVSDGFVTIGGEEPSPCP